MHYNLYFLHLNPVKPEDDQEFFTAYFNHLMNHPKISDRQKSTLRCVERGIKNIVPSGDKLVNAIYSVECSKVKIVFETSNNLLDFVLYIIANIRTKTVGEHELANQFYISVANLPELENIDTDSSPKRNYHSMVCLQISEALIEIGTTSIEIHAIFQQIVALEISNVSVESEDWRTKIYMKTIDGLISQLKTNQDKIPNILVLIQEYLLKF